MARTIKSTDGREWPTTRIEVEGKIYEWAVYEGGNRRYGMFRKAGSKTYWMNDTATTPEGVAAVISKLNTQGWR